MNPSSSVAIQPAVGACVQRIQASRDPALVALTTAKLPATPTQLATVTPHPSLPVPTAPKGSVLITGVSPAFSVSFSTANGTVHVSICSSPDVTPAVIAPGDGVWAVPTVTARVSNANNVCVVTVIVAEKSIAAASAVPAFRTLVTTAAIDAAAATLNLTPSPAYAAAATPLSLVFAGAESPAPFVSLPAGAAAATGVVAPNAGAYPKPANAAAAAAAASIAATVAGGSSAPAFTIARAVGSYLSAKAAFEAGAVGKSDGLSSFSFKSHHPLITIPAGGGVVGSELQLAPTYSDSVYSDPVPLASDSYPPPPGNIPSAPSAADIVAAAILTPAPSPPAARPAPAAKPAAPVKPLSATDISELAESAHIAAVGAVSREAFNLKAWQEKSNREIVSRGFLRPHGVTSITIDNMVGSTEPWPATKIAPWLASIRSRLTPEQFNYVSRSKLAQRPRAFLFTCTFAGFQGGADAVNFIVNHGELHVQTDSFATPRNAKPLRPNETMHPMSCYFTIKRFDYPVYVMTGGKTSLTHTSSKAWSVKTSQGSAGLSLSIEIEMAAATMEEIWSEIKAAISAHPFPTPAPAAAASAQGKGKGKKGKSSAVNVADDPVAAAVAAAAVPVNEEGWQQYPPEWDEETAAAIAVAEAAEAEEAAAAAAAIAAVAAKAEAEAAAAAAVAAAAAAEKAAVSSSVDAEGADDDDDEFFMPAPVSRNDAKRLKRAIRAAAAPTTANTPAHGVVDSNSDDDNKEGEGLTSPDDDDNDDDTEGLEPTPTAPPSATSSASNVLRVPAPNGHGRMPRKSSLKLPSSGSDDSMPGSSSSSSGGRMMRKKSATFHALTEAQLTNGTLIHEVLHDANDATFNADVTVPSEGPTPHSYPDPLESLDTPSARAIVSAARQRASESAESGEAVVIASVLAGAQGGTTAKRTGKHKATAVSPGFAWKDSNEAVTITFPFKNVMRNLCTIKFTDDDMSVNLAVPSGGQYDFKLPFYASVDGAAGIVDISQANIVVTVPKKVKISWPDAIAEGAIEELANMKKKGKKASKSKGTAKTESGETPEGGADAADPEAAPNGQESEKQSKQKKKAEPVPPPGPAKTKAVGPQAASHLPSNLPPPANPRPGSLMGLVPENRPTSAVAQAFFSDVMHGIALGQAMASRKQSNIFLQ